MYDYAKLQHALNEIDRALDRRDRQLGQGLLPEEFPVETYYVKRALVHLKATRDCVQEIVAKQREAAKS